MLLRLTVLVSNVEENDKSRLTFIGRVWSLFHLFGTVGKK